MWCVSFIVEYKFVYLYIVYKILMWIFICYVYFVNKLFGKFI